MLYELKRIDILSAIKVCFFVYLVVGFVIGSFYGIILVSVISSLGGILELNEEILKQFAGYGFIGIIAMGVMSSLFFSVSMTILTSIAVAGYNIVAGMLGGVRCEFKDSAPPISAIITTPEAAND